MTSIYGIFSMETNECKYIGRTKKFRSRCYDHKSYAIDRPSKCYSYPIYQWMRDNEYYFDVILEVEDQYATNKENEYMWLYQDTILNLNFMNKSCYIGRTVNRIKNKQQVHQYDEDMELIKTWDSLKQLSLQLGYSYDWIIRLSKKNPFDYDGYTFVIKHNSNLK